MTPSRRSFLGSGLSAVAVTVGKLPVSLASPAQADLLEASPESQGVDQAALQDILYSGSRVRGLQSIIVVRNGRLIGERYYEGVTMSDLLELYSVTKSVGSMLIGLAIDQGRIKSVGETLGDIFREARTKSPAAPPNGVTLAQILTHTSGLDHDPVSKWQDRTIRSASPPKWDYNNSAVDILSNVIAQAVATPIVEFARRELFAPLGIVQFEWPVDGSGNAQVYKGLKLRARDVAKLAWVMADNGRWNGRQILSAAWVAESTRSQVVPMWRLATPSDVGYGYLWFCGTVRGVPVAWAWGLGGQIAMLVPSRRLAITITTDPLRPNDPELNTQKMRLLERTIELSTP